MKKMSLLFILVFLASCNAQLVGDIVDQSELTDESSETINNVKITKSNNEFMLDIDYVDHDNRYRNEKSVISLYNSDDLRGLKKSFTSLGYAYSGELHCLNMDCSNADFDLNFNRDQESSKTLKIAKREYPINTSAIKFYPNDSQSAGDVLFEAKQAHNQLDQTVMLSLILIQGIKVPLFRIYSSKEVDNNNVVLDIKSNGVDSTVLVGSGRSFGNETLSTSTGFGGNFDIIDYKNNTSGDISLRLKNYTGTVVIDTYR